MPKRPANDENGGVSLKGGSRQMEMDNEQEMGEFEDEFEDDMSDDEIIEAGVDGRPDAEREAEERGNAESMDVDGATVPGTFIVGRTQLEHDQVLSPDLSAYNMLHGLSTPWPCLSFDVLRDQLGDSRMTYPATMYAVTGTQAQTTRASENQLMVLKFSGLGKIQKEADGSDSDSDDNEDDDHATVVTEPVLESKTVPLNSTTNRVRAHQVRSTDPSRPPITLTAAMTESTDVYIFDVTPHLASFDTPGMVVTSQQNKPASTIRAHKAEGYALDWSMLHPSGKLLTGDNDGLIYMTTRTDGGGFVTDTRAFRGHTGSVEEIQWSPSEAEVFASASSDGTVRIWDIRSKSRSPALTVQVSSTDVNVMSWSRQTSHLLATGADDGVWSVWDLRQWKPSASGNSITEGAPIASFSYHKEQITSIEWHPTDDSIIAVAAGDNTVTLWDLAVELDDEESRDTAGVKDVPPQLLFAHYHSNVKEVHWHPQISGVLVATGDEFSVFKTISV